jgi:hypothetical protein
MPGVVRVSPVVEVLNIIRLEIFSVFELNSAIASFISRVTIRFTRRHRKGKCGKGK